MSAVDYDVEALNRGVQHGGTKHTPGTDARPRGSTKQAAAGVVASVFAETARVTGDSSYLDEMAEAAELAAGVAEPEPLTPEEMDELGIEPPRGPAPPLVPRQAQPADEAEPEEEPEAEPEAEAELDLNPDLPDDMLDLLEDEEPADEPEDEEPAYGALAEEEYEEAEGYEDPRTTAIRRENAKLRKQLEQRQRTDLKVQRKHWVGQDAQHFPAVPQSRAVKIAAEAGSRKEFVRRMKAENDELAPHVEALLAGRRQELDQERTTARAQARQEAVDAWGAPVTPGATAAEPSENADRRLRIARERGGLGGMFGEMIRSGRGGIR